MEASELFIPALALGLVLFMLFLGLFNRVVAKLGSRNFLRHKGHAAISVAGLLVGTSIICASMVVGDSIEYFIVEETYNTLDLVDIVIETESGTSFDQSVFTTLDADTTIAGLTDGMAPLYTESVSLRHTTTGQFEPSVNVIGFDADEDADFGSFTTMSGNLIPGDDLGVNDSIINQALAESLNAVAGDDIVLTYTLDGGYAGYGDIQSRTMYVKYIVDDIGKTLFSPGSANALETYNLFVNLDTAQELFQEPGMITHIKVSNIGEIQNSVSSSDEVKAAIETVLADLTFSADDDVPVPFATSDQAFATLSYGNLINGTLELELNGTLLPTSAYEINEISGFITFSTPLQSGDVVTADYDYTFLMDVETTKQDSLEMARDINDLLSTFLTIFGSFAIIAGVILIINIFTMLAEERKSELGMARAVGMKRRHLMLSFLFEGLTYGTVASALGTLFGVVLGAFLIYMINNIATMLAGVVIPFHFENFSLITAFSMGFIITFGTIFLTSWKISRLNIIRAIRGIEEPVSDRKSWLVPIFGILFIIASSIMMFRQWDEFLVKLLAPSGLLVGIMMISWRWIGEMISVTVSSLGVFIYTYYAIHTYFGDAGDTNMELPFILSGVLIVISLVLLVMYNSRPVIMLIVNTFGRAKKFRPTVMTAVSYPLSKKFRTGMSVAMFALVVYMIVMLSVFSSIFVMDLDEETLKQGGGYDIFANSQIPVTDINNVSYFEPTLNMTIDISSDALAYTEITQIAMTVSPEMNNLDAGGNIHGGMGFDFGFFSGTMIFGVDGDFLEGRQFEFTQKMEGYEDVNTLWDAVTAPGSDFVIVSSMTAMMSQINMGDHVTFETMSGNITDEYQVIGIMDQSVMNGVFMSRDNFLKDFGMAGMVSFMFMIDVADGYDILETASLLEKDFATIGLNTIIIRDMAEATMEMMNSMFVLFELYLYMGMVVGVAGLGIITVRSVVERTPEIGILRSIGFKRKNVRNAFLIEILFIATMGVMMGTIAGIMVSYEIFNVMVSGMGDNIEYVIPWFRIALVTVIAYIATILCTIIPANNASKISPAEALRYVG